MEHGARVPVHQDIELLEVVDPRQYTCDIHPGIHQEIELLEGVDAGQYTCDIEPGFPPGNQGGGIMTSATTWVGIIGLYLIAVLLVKKVKAAMVIGIAFVSIQ